MRHLRLYIATYIAIYRRVGFGTQSILCAQCDCDIVYHALRMGGGGVLFFICRR